MSQPDVQEAIASIKWRLKAIASEIQRLHAERALLEDTIERAEGKA